jgi:hypothetical protein
MFGEVLVRGGASVKISRWFAILAFAVAILVFVGLSSSTALADSIPPDPGVKLCCGGGSTSITTQNFFFVVPVGASSMFDFVNNFAPAIELDLTEVISQAIPIPVTDRFFVCDNTFDFFFTTCTPTVSTLTNEVRFFGLDPSSGINGIPLGADFSLTITGNTTSSFTFEGTLVTPEPSTVLLVLVGIVFPFLSRRARWVPKPA